MQKNLKAYAHTAQQAIPLQDESRTEESRWTARRLTRTVPREYTHRAAVAEVFLTDWAPGQPDGFVVSAQWPRGHSFFLQRSGYQDPLLIAESVRQVGSLIAHAEFGVPLGHHFLMHNLSYTVTEQGLATAPIPTEVEMRVTCHDLSKRGGQLTGMRYQVTLVRDGRSVGFAEADFNCLSPRVYQRLRGRRPTSVAPARGQVVPPASVGRVLPSDVVLLAPEKASHRWQLHLDTRHPILFDHPVDHVPGMVLMEAARQAAQAVHPLPVLALGMDSTFSRFAELDAPCWIEAEVAEDSGLVHVTGTQNGSTVFTAHVTTWHA
ncbi:ScbA/BarX family gamma-butyrolactone biosynthesis protein [Streptomyces naganishii]|uniref:ScbA/BarX family gamma-butyrolactone biosynthesis protein n=1 Tax=Streptomyces naganishii TaxID=285447 RepID=UPI00167D3FA4|nr:ScbA/BarX family gamma-butyrolactone biosynthesis protein [Streptomyces naganishii]